MKIISRTWAAPQAEWVYEYIANNTSELPTTGIAYGSNAVCADGKIYFLFEDGTWKAVGAQA